MHIPRLPAVILPLLLAGGCAQLPGQQPGNGSPLVLDDDMPYAPAGRPAAVTTQERQEDNLWAELRASFALPDSSRSAVTGQARVYGRNPTQIERIFSRAEPWLAYIFEEVERRDFPGEIALLPFVESGFDPYAYSRGRAAGLWQFIPGTGKAYGLEQDWWYDGRRDVVASTGAALDHLGKLHTEFNGDWLLALAAYNAGGGTVRNAIKRNEQAGRPVDFWHLDLPAETTEYVPRLLAVASIVRNPGHYGVALAPLKPVPRISVVDTGGQLDLGIAAQLAGMEAVDLHRLNPGFNRWATHPDGPHQLVLPVDRQETFENNLASLPDEQRTRWQRHRIRSGETLSHIARRYDTTVEVLRKTNHLRGTGIRAGQHLLIPEATSDVNLPELERVLAAPAGASATGKGSAYTVRKGDTLWNIARAHKVSISQLTAWNGLQKSAAIRPGQTLKIGDSGSSTAGASPVRTIQYTVRKGDSLYRIARKYSVTVQDLRDWNNIGKRDQLRPGQRLTLKINVTEVAQG